MLIVLRKFIQMTLSGILGQVDTAGNSEMQLGSADVVFFIICLGGIILLAKWLLRTSLGRKALACSAPRRNNMPFYIPFVPIAFWLGLTLIGQELLLKGFLTELPEWQQEFFKYLIYGMSNLATAVMILLLARETFARRLKGFGLEAKTAGRDFAAAWVNLIVVLPIMVAVMWAVAQIGQLIVGQDFQMQRHEGLEIITRYPQIPVRAVLIIITVVIGPVFEEVLYRGLFQTMIRAVAGGPWRSIMITSAIFALMHQDWMHWPGLFVLSVCMGYSYEKSGSLFRPIFVHSLFNATSILAALNQ